MRRFSAGAGKLRTLYDIFLRLSINHMYRFLCQTCIYIGYNLSLPWCIYKCLGFPSHTKDLINGNNCEMLLIRAREIMKLYVARRVAPDYAADSSVPILNLERNAIEKEIGSSTMFVDNGQLFTKAQGYLVRLDNFKISLYLSLFIITILFLKYESLLLSKLY